MLKYHSSYIGFREIPDEITLCINISNCPNNCKGCHSPWLLEDVGTPLTYLELMRLIEANKGITCVSFMGGDREPWEIYRLARLIKEEFPELKTAWYSGKEYSKDLETTNLNYIKVGPYIQDRGGLDSPNTNQILYLVYTAPNGVTMLINITHKFNNNDIRN